MLDSMAGVGDTDGRIPLVRERASSHAPMSEDTEAAGLMS
jgi:hypothetical protein